jgi:protein-L-isoaspartate(D-aspartate) O-methyltransferase
LEVSIHMPVVKQPMSQIEKYTNSMISTIRSYGVHDEYILDAMRTIPRHNFLPEGTPLDRIYGDHPLPIGGGQTISQPFTVAYMLELLRLKEGMSVLEIGAGSGWCAALIKELVGPEGHVVAVEIVGHLVRMARKHCMDAGIEIEIIHGDGSLGCEEYAPYDRIIVSCAAPRIMDAWTEQLKLGGVIVVPLGKFGQEMIQGVKRSRGLQFARYGMFSFVPLTREVR